MGAIRELLEKFGKEITVERCWMMYASKTLKPAGVDPADVQWRECKKVFYAAWHGLLELQLHVVGHPDFPEEEGEALLSRMLSECEAFAASLAPESGRPRKH